MRRVHEITYKQAETINKATQTIQQLLIAMVDSGSISESNAEQLNQKVDIIVDTLIKVVILK